MLVSSVKMRLRRQKLRPRRTQLHKMCRLSSTSYSIDVVSSYVESHPEDALAVDKRGMTPLHHVLAQLPHRNDIAALLIEKAPEACGMRDKDGATPLHLAARNADLVPGNILTSLLRYDPSLALDEDGHGETPFSLYCAALERTAKNAEFLKMIRSRTDPDSACTSGIGETCRGPLLDKAVPFVRAIAWGQPRTAPDRNNVSYEKIWSKMLHTTLYAVERAASASIIHSAEGKGGTNMNAIAAANSRRYRFLVRAMMKRTHQKQGDEEHGEEGNDEQQEQPQQEQGEVGIDTEQGLQQQQQAQAQQGGNGNNGQQQQQQQTSQLSPTHEVDSRGNLPLHIAAAVPFLNGSPGPSEMLAPLPSMDDDNGDNGRIKSEGIIDALVRLHPEAASTRDAAGLLPFCIAEQHRSGWTKGGVGSILSANTTVLIGMEDLNERVMPQVLSKVGRDLELGAMFEILKERPEVLLQATK